MLPAMIQFRKVLGATLLACLVLAPTALADVTASPYVSSSNPRLGAHGDLTTGATFTYGSSTTESAKRVIYDLPAGLTFNAGAVAVGDVCSQSTFDNGVCPAASQVGSVKVTALATLGIFTTTIPDLPGTISLIQGAGGATKLGLRFYNADPEITLRATEQLSTISGGVVRLTSDVLPKSLTAAGQTATFQLTKLEQKLFGTVGGTSFITNPASGTSWDAFAYFQGFDSNTNANSDPLAEGGGNHFVKSSALTIAVEPDPPATPSTPPPGPSTPAPTPVDYSVSVKNVKKCLKTPSLQVTPTIASAAQVASITILANKKQVKKLTAPTISAKVKLPKSLKLKKNKSYSYEVQVQFKPDAANPNGLIVKKSAKFKLCK
jgi:hypothetical protein